MVHNVQNLMFIIVCVLMYSSYAYGDIWKSAPDIPQENIKKDCEGWIEHYGFDSDVMENREMALDRAREYDPDVSIWAAVYAYFISSFNELSLIHPKCCSPSEFCERFSNAKSINSYLPLKNVKLTCDQWIFFYGYHPKKTTINFFMAFDRKKEDDHIMHVWVAMFSRYAEDITRYDIEPSVFCWSIGKYFTPKPNKLPFVTLDTQLSCLEWIEHSDYNDDVEINTQKALLLNNNFLPYINKWTVLYVKYLKKFVPKPMTPEEFCISINLPFDRKVYYNKY